MPTQNFFDIIRLKTVDSTNNYAKAIMDELYPKPFIVIADEQTKGRGQQGNSWHSEAGKNLLFSMGLFPTNLRADEQFMLNKLVSLAAYRFIYNYAGKQTAIKWPNDILAGKNKIAGILIENFISAEKLNKSIVGIGININQTDFPKDLPRAVSLKLLDKKTYHTADCLNEFIALFESLLPMLQKSSFAQLHKAYMDALYGLNKVLPYRYKNETIKAVIKGVDVYGRLILSREDNKEICCNFKEIEFLF